MKKFFKSKSPKFWLNGVILVLIVVVLVSARKDIVAAMREITQANWLILALIVPLQLISYFASTEIFLSYLRLRGQLRDVNAIEATSMSLEFNFINHVFPSGGISGIGYMGWRLGKFGVNSGQSTLSQILRYILQIFSFMILLILSLLWTMGSQKLANWVVVGVTAAIVGFIFILFFGAYFVGSKERMLSFSHFFYVNLNKFIDWISYHRKKQVLAPVKCDKFFLDFHLDFLALKADKKILFKPILWAFVFTITDVSLFFVVFHSLGIAVDPAILFIAYGAATLSGTFMITPGGAGAYEGIMIGVLTAGHLSASYAFAGVILTRVLLIFMILLAGGLSYRQAVKKYGDFRQEDKNAS